MIRKERGEGGGRGRERGEGKKGGSLKSKVNMDLSETLHADK